MSQGDVIETLYYHPDSNTVEISVYLNITQRAVTQSIKQLRTKGFVTMVKNGAGIRYALTGKGRYFAEEYYL